MVALCMKPVTPPRGGAPQPCGGVITDFVIADGPRVFLESYCLSCGRCPHMHPLLVVDDKVMENIDEYESFVGSVGPNRH